MREIAAQRAFIYHVDLRDPTTLRRVNASFYGTIDLWDPGSVATEVVEKISASGASEPVTALAGVSQCLLLLEQLRKGSNEDRREDRHEQYGARQCHN